MDTLIRRADELQQKARLLLEKYPFAKLAGKYFGNITSTGSLVFNCMVDADLDFNIVVKPLDKRKIIAFVEILTELKVCRKVCLYNRMYEKLPYFIINVERLNFDGENWVLTFFIQEEDFQETIKRSKELKEKLTPPLREIILKIKEWRLSENLKTKIPSVWVYEAVLHEGIRSIGEFEQWLQYKK